MHNRHGRQVVMAGITQRAGLFLVAMALFLLAALLLWNYVLPF